MTASKTNERIGTRATLRGYQMSASKARVVLNIVRGEDVNTAREILAGTTREAADVIGKVLASAVANAVNNDGLLADIGKPRRKARVPGRSLVFEAVISAYPSFPGPRGT